MDIASALTTIQARGGYVTVPPVGVRHTTIEVSSGRARKSAKDPHPALWTTEHDAVWEFYKFAELYLIGKGERTWWWSRVPALEQHQMTEMDVRGQHRVQQTRWAVSGSLSVEDR